MSSQTNRFLSARWHHLVMLNYEMDPEVFAQYVPRGTHLDGWNGRFFASLVAFQFLETRVLGIPIPFHRNFEEVNLRFYVRRQCGDDSRRGVVFLKEIVPRRAVAWLANALYNEKYIALPMTHDDQVSENGSGAVLYGFKHGDRWCRLGATVTGECVVPAADSEERFITEHYWGYTSQRDGSTLEYRVEHPQWAVWQGTEAVFDCEVASLYGKTFEPFLRGTPSSCFVAKGSEVLVRRGVPVPE